MSIDFCAITAHDGDPHKLAAFVCDLHTPVLPTCSRVIGNFDPRCPPVPIERPNEIAALILYGWQCPAKGVWDPFTTNGFFFYFEPHILNIGQWTRWTHFFHAVHPHDEPPYAYSQRTLRGVCCEVARYLRAKEVIYLPENSTHAREPSIGVVESDQPFEFSRDRIFKQYGEPVLDRWAEHGIEYGYDRVTTVGEEPSPQPSPKGRGGQTQAFP